MVAASVLDGKATVSVSGSATATSSPSNFVIQGSPADVANYARQGNDLVIEMKSGQTVRISNFAQQGMDFNNLVFTQGETSSLVNFNAASSVLGDGIIDALVTVQTIGAGASTAALLGILGAASVGGAVLAAAENNSGTATPVDPTDPDPTDPTDKTPPAAPSILAISDDDGVSSTDGVTTDNTLVFSGTAEANSKVEVFLNGNSIGTATADANGNWSLDHTGTELASGSYTLTATATDAAGNTSTVSNDYDFVVMPTPMPIPLGVTITGNGGDNGGLITFTFTELIDAASFDESDITVANGVLVGGSLTQDSVDPKIWTITVTPDLGATNTNVAVTLAAGAVSSGSGALNSEAKNLTTLFGLFNSNSLLSGDITGWDTSHATSARSLFTSNPTFNQNIGGWDVSKVENMSGMFASAAAFNQDIGNWDVGNVQDMGGMFSAAYAFDQHIGGWDVSSVTTMNSMFLYATVFNQDIGGWDVSNVTNMRGMFGLAQAFDQDISSWNVGNVVTMNEMFSAAYAFDQDIGGWNVSKVANMSSMFRNATLFDQNLGGWDISSLTNAADMFTDSGMSVQNMDLTLRGWAKLDTTAGETAIQNGVMLNAANFSDITAVQYLIDHYNWSIFDNLISGVKVGLNGTDDVLDYSSSTSPEMIHGLGGNDTITGGSDSDWIVGGAGDDTLTGYLGSDTFHYGFSDAGNDTITDFVTGPGGDILHLSDLLVGYDSGTSTLSNYITAEETGGGLHTLLTVHYDGSGAASDIVTIQLNYVAYTGNLLDDMIANGNLVLA